MTFDSSKIDADLTSFPFTIILTDVTGIESSNITAIFNEIGANNKKMALVNPAGDQCYVEIAQWSPAASSSEISYAELYAADTVDGDADSTYYLYYDKNVSDNTTYIKDHGAGTSVWNSNFLAVQHMNDLTTSTIEDSTSNNADGSKSSANNPIESTGKNGKSQDFSSDGINLGATCGASSAFTCEAWVKTDVIDGNDNQIMNRWEAVSPYRGWRMVFWSGYVAFGAYTTAWVDAYSAANAIVSTSDYYYVVGVYDGSNLTVYVNGAVSGTPTAQSGSINYTNAGTAYIGSDVSFGHRYFNGKIDEVRFSDTNRSAAWIKASYYSGDNKLITFSDSNTNVQVTKLTEMKSAIIANWGADTSLETYAQGGDTESWTLSTPTGTTNERSSTWASAGTYSAHLADKSDGSDGASGYITTPDDSAIHSPFAQATVRLNSVATNKHTQLLTLCDNGVRSVTASVYNVAGEYYWRLRYYNGSTYTQNEIAKNNPGIKPVVVCYTGARLVRKVDAHITPNGYMDKVNEFSEHVSGSRKAFDSNEYDNQALAYWHKVLRFMESDKTLFPQYFVDECGCGTSKGNVKPKMVPIGGNDCDYNNYSRYGKLYNRRR